MIVNEYDHELQNEKYRSIFGRQVKPETIAKVALGCVQEETETIQVVENTETQSEVSPEGHEDLSFDPAKLSEHASGKQTTDPDSSALPLFVKEIQINWPIKIGLMTRRTSKVRRRVKLLPTYRTGKGKRIPANQTVHLITIRLKLKVLKDSFTIRIRTNRVHKLIIGISRGGKLMSQKKRVTMEALRKRMPVIDPDLAEAAWDALENIEPGLVKRVNREDLAALMMDYMVRVAIARTENSGECEPCTFRAAFIATWKRWKTGLVELRRRIAMAGMVLWTGGVS